MIDQDRIKLDIKNDILGMKYLICSIKYDAIHKTEIYNVIYNFLIDSNVSLNELNSESFKNSIYKIYNILNYLDEQSNSYNKNIFIISTKPETKGCKNATGYRYNLFSEKKEVNLEHECKTMVFSKENILYIFITPSTYNINNSFITKCKLFDLNKISLKPYAVNPINLFKKIDKKYNIFVYLNYKFLKNDFITNNIGSRFISLSIDYYCYLKIIKEAFDEIDTDKKEFFVCHDKEDVFIKRSNSS